MKKFILVNILMLLFVFIGTAQHLKKDGTPDRRYKENKNLPPTTQTTPNTQTKTTVLPMESNNLAQQKDTVTYKYCEVIGVDMAGSSIKLGNECEVSINFGDGNLLTSDNPLKDKNGKSVKMENAISIVNFLSGDGWVLNQSFGICWTAGKSTKFIYHYTMRKLKY